MLVAVVIVAILLLLAGIFACTRPREESYVLSVDIKRGKAKGRQMSPKNQPLKAQLENIKPMPICWDRTTPSDVQAKLGDNKNYEVGVSKRDITGPMDIVMMGYAMGEQVAKGILSKLYARAFCFKASDNGGIFCLVNLDLQGTQQSITQAVLTKLSERFPRGELNSSNVMLSSIHTHSGPGGYSWHFLYNATIKGYYKPYFEHIVDKTVEAIVESYESMKPATLSFGQGFLPDAHFNRAKDSYNMNPESERKCWEEYYGNTGMLDDIVTVLRIDSEQGPMGVLCWYAVHASSIGNENKYINGDNKGYAAYLFEKKINGDTPGGSGPFVAGFIQANEGDVSPNTAGACCENQWRWDPTEGRWACPEESVCTGLPIDCGGRIKKCRAKGPGITDVDSAKIIGEKQYRIAFDIYNGKLNPVEGDIQSHKTNIDMENFLVDPAFSANGEPTQTCYPTMGIPFTWGTIDGYGQDTSGLDNSLSQFGKKLFGPSADIELCQQPKVSFMDVSSKGKSKIPWIPVVTPIQLSRIGQLVLMGVPSEFSTMSGRRAGDVIRQYFPPTDFVGVITGLANIYNGYITTHEEYKNQRYEGASTAFGENTLGAYLQTFNQLAIDMRDHKQTFEGIPLPDLSKKQTRGFITKVLVDGGNAGEQILAPQPEVIRGHVVFAVFKSSHPQNAFWLIDTYMAVERLVDGEWIRFRNDNDWDTTFDWKRQGVDRSVSTVVWRTGIDTPVGTYRFFVQSYKKRRITSDNLSYRAGVSSEFKVV